MFNEFVLVGRLTEDPTLKRIDVDMFVTNITLAVNRPFKNSEGEHECDFLRIAIWDAMAKSTCDFCRKGDMIAVRGRVVTRIVEIPYDKEDQELKKKLQIIELIAERVIFLNTTGHPEEVPDVCDYIE